MSCEQNTKAYEACLERFWEYMADCEFRSFISEHLLSYPERRGETKYYFNKAPYNKVFEYFWERDCEGMYRDIKGTIEKYVEEHK